MWNCAVLSSYLTLLLVEERGIAFALAQSKSIILKSTQN